MRRSSVIIYSPEIWTNSERLFIATITILLAGFFHSLTVLYPAIKSNEIRTEAGYRRASHDLKTLPCMTG